MGCGFLEAVYQKCLEKELKLRGIPLINFGHYPKATIERIVK